MAFDFTVLLSQDGQRSLCNFIAPRRIASVTTMSTDGLSKATQSKHHRGY